MYINYSYYSPSQEGGGGERGKDGAKTSPKIFPLLPGLTPNLALEFRQHP
jgi:hypothetical protein